MPCPLVKSFLCFRWSSCLHLQATLYLQKFWNSLVIAGSITYWKNWIFIGNFSILIYLSPLLGTRKSTASIVNRLLARKSGVQIPAEARVLFYSTSGLIMGSTQQPSEWVPWCSFPGGKEAGTMRLNTYLHLVPKLRMNGVVLSLPLYAFMTCTGTTS